MIEVLHGKSAGLDEIYAPRKNAMRFNILTTKRNDRKSRMSQIFKWIGLAL